MKFHIITLFPEMFDSYLGESILGRAIKEKKISVSFVNPRKFVTGKYRKVWPDGNVSLQVDERPYAGGPGMVMMAEPVIKAVESVLKKITNYQLLITKNNSKSQKPKAKSSILIINFIPSAEKFTTSVAKSISKKYTDVILICGRYEGIDARVDKILRTKKYSIGDYVLTGGEIPAMILIDCISRQVDGVLGNFDSREEERVSSSEIYTRPEILIHKGKKHKVPKVLLSGNHKDIESWKNRLK
ncbi:MAG: tRNA (guanine-N(1)-)-methyltransferase [Candidatus Nomurabacteria bacterium GW2011_GWF2_35_66]|uniref:tRNA (guanine-N(1)-)-methyltransferase n=1 Tax=Candidatus Nomurabacteria bacterium GW2011_GWE1_35_16 TaxID=1618761 RepID=A0A0G0BB95_9BACT|nr:MAG: tRNA (guanine-N(1)-)-methyltransferase [Candidatus Nomurabacteria bacterium GW2011_GWF1_34_20]KKP63561.1 MAG: tRNA (guanine-N(1)-)-methyltransferase [Candidatus Nomurabacteria bacterium GW2011_GWE2_34_25]KKP66753.1 MAG: tRNA (guanine-N(1)-)-methyltransferase [Candidatus Nomurabacteria bacterium GW2011_GWE1_35_16]KKP83853.1 MAG: tRNA (guanine-N(1)-)-methyltransferase [Candidatus Nomurabacteria bacterium GW2011_GWF2_35_66]HAE36358.1 tRNA (guanosine(37)-N1)-methyltransferase TrmD [Candidat